MQRTDENERNCYINENYARLSKLCKRCAYRAQNTFWNVSIEDLSAYGMLGVIYALDRMDYSNPGCFKYIEFYCLSYAISGAMSMCGIKREKRTQATKVRVSCLLTDPYDLARLQEEIQQSELTFGMTEEDRRIERLDFESYLNLSSCETTRVIMRLLRDNKSFDEISELLQISKRTVRRKLIAVKVFWRKRSKLKISLKRLDSKK